MNHCLLEVRVNQAPTVRYTQDNKTPLAEMEVVFDGLRADDPPSSIKVVGWGNMAQDLQNRVQVNQKLILEGRLRMNTISKQDGSKEKKAEFTLSKFHFIPEQQRPMNPQENNIPINDSRSAQPSRQVGTNPNQTENESPPQNNLNWNTSPLIPDTDEIPF